MNGEQATNPTPEAQANPPQAEAPDQDVGSQIGPNTIISVPHPGIPEEGDHPGQAQDANPQPGEATADQDQAKAQPNKGDGQPGNQDGQAPQPYKKLKYRGREVPVESEEQLTALAQQGLDYTTKTQMLGPYMQELKALMAIKADPARARQLQAIMEGREPEAGAASQGQDRGIGQPPRVYLRGADGNVIHDDKGHPVEADPVFVQTLLAVAKDMGWVKPEGGQGGKLPPEIAGIVTERQVDKVAVHVQETYGRGDFRASVPLIKRAMVEQGITAGDPRDNPQTWVGIYAHLAMSGALDKYLAGRPGAKAEAAGQGGEPPKSVKRENKNSVKEAAQAASTQMNQPPGVDRKAAMNKALKTGVSRDWVAAVGASIYHPDIHGSQ